MTMMMMMMTSDHLPRQAPTQWQWGEMGAGGSLAGLPRWGAWPRSAASWWWMWTAWPGLPRLTQEPGRDQQGSHWGRTGSGTEGRKGNGGERWPGCPTKDRATNTTLTWQNAKDSEVSFCHCGKWQKAMDDPAFVFVTILLWFSFSIVHSAFVRGHYISLHQLSLSIVTLPSPGNLMPVLHLLAPDEEAIASKACANKFFYSDLSLYSSRTRRKTIIKRDPVTTNNSKVRCIKLEQSDERDIEWQA